MTSDGTPFQKMTNEMGAFKTPTIRNVALTAPYMHDGSVATLEEVVEWYDKGGHPTQTSKYEDQASQSQRSLKKPIWLNS